MSIRWTEQCVTEVVREMRAHNVAGGGHREATLDDLRKACEAVGLVCMSREDAKNAVDQAGNDGFSRGCVLHKDKTEELRTRAERAEAEREAATARADEYDSRLTAMRVALTAAGVPESEAYPEEAGISERERSLRTGGRMLGGVERIERLAAERDAAIARAEKAERLHAEEKDAFLLVADAVGLVHEQSMGPRFAGPAEDVVAEVRGFVAENARLTAELKVLKAPVAGEPSDAKLAQAWEAFDGCGPEGFVRFSLAQWRAGHAAGLAQAQPTAERATDEELVRIGEKALNDERGLSAYVTDAAKLAAVRAVAARVRAERCLVTRAVESGKHFSVVSNDRGRWYVTVIGLGEENVAPADVVPTLERMLGGGQ